MPCKIQSLMAMNLSYDELEQIAHAHGFEGERWSRGLSLIMGSRLIF